MLDETEVSFLKKVSSVKFGYWTLSTQEQSINDGDIKRKLEPLVFDLLLYFILNNDRIISRQELVDNVWKQNYVDDNAINRAISELRKALKSEKQIARVVKTHYRTGYSFMLPIELEYYSDMLVSQERPTSTIQVKSSAEVKQSISATSDNEQLTSNDELTKSTDSTDSVPTQKRPQYIYIASLFLLFAGAIYLFKLYSPTESSIQLPEKSIPLSFSEEMLTWDEGSVGVIKLSKDKNLLAYSFENLQEAEYSLRIKDLNTLKLYKILSGSDHIYPLAWSEDHTLIYQILNSLEEKCELWQVDFAKPELNNDHKKLFDCGATEIISADIASIDNKLIYSKFNYRGKNKLSALVNRDLRTGAEFQISSPNSELRGDYFVALSDDQQKIAFLRSQQLKTEIFVANKDGSEQIKVLSVDYGIRLLAWGNSDTELLWFNAINNNLVTFDLNTNKISTKLIDSEHSLTQRFKTEIINDKHFLLATKNYALDIDKLAPNNANSQLTSYLNSPFYESFVAPFNLSDASIFHVWKKESSFWIYKDGIRKKLFNSNIEHISGVSLSPDDSMLLIASNKKLFIYNTQDYTLTKEILLPGKIKQASWPLQNKLLLTYTEEGSKTFAWFYHLQQEKIIKLTNLYTRSAKLVSNNKLFFLDENFHLINKNILSGESNTLVRLSDKSGVLWTADENNIYYLKNRTDRLIRKIPVNDTNKEETFSIPNKRVIYELNLYNDSDNPILYVGYSKKTANHILDLKIKQ
ncbi:winged helix-turn-helix domain-containing protein [Colwelliaceae bacterium MEBiC 14330]